MAEATGLQKNLHGAQPGTTTGSDLPKDGAESFGSHFDVVRVGGRCFPGAEDLGSARGFKSARVAGV